MPSLCPKRLYLRGLPKNATSEDLEKYLTCYGKITEVKVLPSCAFVQFESEKDALAVLETFRNKPFLGKHIVIEFAHPLRKDMATNAGIPKIRSSGPRGQHTRFTVLVSDIPRGVRWQELKDFGRLSGNLVAFCDIDRYRNGFIEYFSREDAKRAVTALDGKYLGGKRVHVHEHHSNSGLYTRYRPRSKSPLRRSTLERYQDNDQALLVKDGARLSADGWLSPPKHGHDLGSHCPRYSPSNPSNEMSHLNSFDVNLDVMESLYNWAGSPGEYRQEYDYYKDHQYAHGYFYDEERPEYGWNEDKTQPSMYLYHQ